MKDIGNSSNFTEEEELFLLRNKQGKIVGIKDLKQANFQETMKDWKKHLPKPSLLSIIIWVAVALLGGLAWSLIALAQGETINAIWFVIAAVCSYLIGYRFYALYIQRKIMRPNDLRATPSESHNDGKEFDPTWAFGWTSFSGTNGLLTRDNLDYFRSYFCRRGTRYACSLVFSSSSSKIYWGNGS